MLGCEAQGFKSREVILVEWFTCTEMWRSGFRGHRGHLLRGWSLLCRTFHHDTVPAVKTIFTNWDGSFHVCFRDWGCYQMELENAGTLCEAVRDGVLSDTVEQLGQCLWTVHGAKERWRAGTFIALVFIWLTFSWFHDCLACAVFIWWTFSWFHDCLVCAVFIWLTFSWFSDCLVCTVFIWLTFSWFSAVPCSSWVGKQTEFSLCDLWFGVTVYEVVQDNCMWSFEGNCIRGPLRVTAYVAIWR